MIHVLVPITRRFPSYQDTYERLAERVSRGLEAENPGLADDRVAAKKKRRGVLLDHRQNGHAEDDRRRLLRSGRSRARETRRRSAGEELGEKVRPRDFGRRGALQRVERYGDLLEPVCCRVARASLRPCVCCVSLPGRVRGPSGSVSMIP